MAKVELLTPVHVGTGLSIEAPSFHQVGNRLDRYNFSDLMEHLPKRVLLDPVFLSQLSSSQKDKSFFYSKINSNVEYKDCDRLYTVRWNQPEYFIHLSYDIEEQVKDLNRPYIPGSTLKGALESAFRYAILKDEYSAVERNLPDFLENAAGNRGKIPDGFVLQLLDSSVSEREASEFFRQLYACLLVRDVYFQKMEIFYAGRENVDPGKNSIPSYQECIQADESSELDQLIEIDQKKLERLKQSCQGSKAKMILCTNFTVPFLVKACNVYFADVIESDKDENICEMFESFDNGYRNLYKPLLDMQKEARAAYESGDCLYMRVGKDTSYFFKTVSWLIRSKSFDLYSRYFRDVFSPLGRRMTEIRKMTPEKMPVTRVILNNADRDYLAGFIRITL